MSGAWRSAARSAVGKSGASTPISICSTIDRRCGCSYSIGSSMVMMWRASRRLISLTSAASVVVLPEPVGPPTRTRPRGSRVSASIDGGRPSEAKRGTVGRQAADRRRGAAALVVQVDAEAAEVRRRGTSRRRCRARDTAGARAAPAPARPRPRFPRRRAAPSGSGTTWPSMRSDGGAPGTSSRSLADRVDDLARASARSRAVCSSERARLRRAGVQLGDQRVEIVRGPSSRRCQSLSSGAFRKRVSGATCRNTVSSVL